MDELKSREQLLQEIDELKNRVAKLEEMITNEEVINLSTLNALRLSEEKFSNAFYCSPDIITISYLNNARYIDVNDAYLNTVGYTREEVIGHTSFELGIWQFPFDRARLLQQLQENGRVRNLEFAFCSRNGELKTTLVSADIIKLNGNECLLCVVKDISDRKQMEKNLVLSEQRFNKAFYCSPITMSITTLREGRFLNVNDRFCRVLGYCRETLMSSSSTELNLWVD